MTARWTRHAILAALGLGLLLPGAERPAQAQTESAFRWVGVTRACPMIRSSQPKDLDFPSAGVVTLPANSAGNLCNDVVKWTLRSNYQGTSLGNSLMSQASSSGQVRTSPSSGGDFLGRPKRRGNELWFTLPKSLSYPAQITLTVPYQNTWYYPSPTYRTFEMEHPRKTVARAMRSGGFTRIGGGDPQVSFADDLYPLISGNSCNICHSGGSNYPQRSDRPAICQVSGCGANTIPFSTSISASTMRSRFMCLEACSGDPQYSQARGKVYVVPGNPAQSGLHHKAQESNAGAFGASLTIDGTTHPVREWIRIWIEQGANP